MTEEIHNPERSKDRPLVVWIADHELWLLTAAAPFLLFPNRWTPLAGALIGLIWICRWRAWGVITIPTSLDAPIVILVATASVGLYASVDLPTSLASLWRLLLGVAIYYGLVNSVRNGVQLRSMALLLIAGCLGMASLTLFGTRWSIVRLISWPQLYNHIPTLFRAADGAGAFHPRTMGMALATLFPLPVALLLFGEARVYRISSGLLVPLMGLLMLLTQSIQALVGISAALLLLAVCRNRWFLLTIPLVAGILWWGVTGYGLGRLLSVDDLLGIGVVLRLDMWGRALAMIRDMPYTGIGLDTFPTIQTNFYPGFLIGSELHAHNLFLQIALDLGLVGLAAFLWLLIAFGITATQVYCLRTDHDGRALIVGLGAALASYVASQAIETYWETRLGEILWILLGSTAAIFALGQRQSAHNIQSREASRTIKSVLWMVPLMLLVLSLILDPHLKLNLTILQAHKQLIQARSSSLSPAQVFGPTIQKLEQAQIGTPYNVHTYALLGSLYAWQGDYPAALEALDQRVALDGQDPIGRYAPFEVLLRHIRNERDQDPWNDLLRVYSQWMYRFPSRAEEYVQLAIVWHRYKQDAEKAAMILHSGLDHGAQPQGLLVYYLSQSLGQGFKKGVSRFTVECVGGGGLGAARRPAPKPPPPTRAVKRKRDELRVIDY